MEKKKEEFNPEEYLNNVANDYIDRMDDCFDEIRDYIMKVDPTRMTGEQIRDAIYQIFRQHGF